MNTSKGFNQRVPRLIVACVVMLAIGFIYGWSVFSAPLTAEFGWEATTLSFTFTLLMWMFCAGGILGAKLCARTSPRVVLIAVGLFILVSFCSTTFLVTKETPWILYITYGALGGFGVGMGYTVTMGATVVWFPERTGIRSGCLLLCYGASTMVLGSAAAWLFEIVGWRVAFIALSSVIAVILIVASFILRYPTDEEEAAHLAPLRRKAAEAAGAKSTANVRSYTTKEMTSKAAFWTYVGWMVSVSCVGLGYIGSTNQIALESGAGVALAVALVGTLSVCNGCGRLIGGAMFDRLGTTRTMGIVAFLHALGCAMTVASLLLHSVPLMVVTIVVTGLGLGCVSALGSGFMANVFGPKHYAENLGVLNLALIPAALIGPFIMSLSATNLGSYAPGTGVLVCLGLLAIMFAFLTHRAIKKM